MISVGRARMVDRKLGRPLCALLGLFHRFRGRRRAPDLDQVRKILVIKMWGLGSIVLASPVFRQLRLGCPQAHITFLTLAQNKGLYDDTEWFDETLYFELSSWRAAWGSLFRILGWLWRERVDLVLDLEFASRVTALLCFVGRARFTLGYAPAGSGKDLFDLTVPYHESEHITRIFLRSVDALGLSSHDEGLIPLPQPKDDVGVVRRFLSDRVDRFIVFNPNTSDLAPERMWPLDRFAILAERVLQEWPGLTIVLIGARTDQQRVNTLLEMINAPGVISVAGLLTIRQTACLLDLADAFVSNDSGPLHLGVAVDVPTIGLFGPETPVLYGPRGPNHRAVTSRQICSPCISIYNDKVLTCTRDALCMKEISVEDQVLAPLNGILRQTVVRV